MSRALARWRTARYSDVRYAIDGTISERALRGVITICVTLDRPQPIVLDWKPAAAPSVTRLRVNDHPCTGATLREEHLVVPSTATQRGENRISVPFRAPIAAAGTPLIRYSEPHCADVFVYSLFVPAHARRVFPCFDQPDLKAQFTLALTVPRGWRAVSNTASRAVRPCRFEFAATPPLSTYLFAFAAGPFVAWRAPRSKHPSTLYVRRSQASTLARHRGAIARLCDASLRDLEQFTACALPTPMLDLVLLADFPYGGMEHAGAIFMNEAAMFALDDAARRRRAALIFHENAHQWFGNLATMRWFDDLWLKEGFANLLAARQLDRLTGWSGRQFLADLATNIHGAPPLRPALSNLDHAWTVYNAVPYGRGPAVLDALAARLGAVRFRRLVRALVARYAKSNFASDDLIDCVRTTAGGTASRWLATRIAGRPADARGARLAAKSPLRSAPTPDEPALARLLAHASRPSRHAKAAVLATLLRRPTLPDRWLDTCLPPLFAPEHTTITIELIPVAVALLSERVATCPLFTIDRWLAVLIAGAATAPAQRALRNAARQLPRGAELRHKILATKVTS